MPRFISLLLTGCWILFSAFGVGVGRSEIVEGRLYTVSKTVNIRAARSIQAKIVGRLYPGEKFRASLEKDNWAAVFLVDDTIQDEAMALGYVYVPLMHAPADATLPEARGSPPPADEILLTLSNAHCKLLSSPDQPGLGKILPALSRISEPHFDDLPGISKRRTLRVLTTYDIPNYFISQGKGFGFEYSLLRDYERFLNQQQPSQSPGIVVAFFPIPQNKLIQSLKAGLGDVVAAGRSVVDTPPNGIEYTDPYLEDIQEMLVAHKNAPPIKTLADLSGRQVFTRQVPSHLDTLAQLNERLSALDLPPIQVVLADTFLRQIDVLEMLNAGIAQLGIIQNHSRDLWLDLFPNLRAFDITIAHTKRKLAWIVRRDSPKLKASLNAFLKKHKKGTLHGNIYFTRYFKNTQWIVNPLNANDRVRFSRYTPLFKKYGHQYDFDWMMIAAIAYQESRLNPLRRSPAGAIGLMQVLPTTARSPKVGIKNPQWLENNVHAGTKYLAILRSNHFGDPDVSEQDRINFALAAYNAGPKRIQQARLLAKDMGLDPNQWFRNVELSALQLIGNETVRYVRNVNKYYIAYSLASTLDCLKRAAVSE